MRKLSTLPDGSFHCINPPQTLRPTLPPRAIIKVASPDNSTTMENLNRERRSYLLPGVASAACFRKLYDVIDNGTIALEWLDTALAEVKCQPNMRTYVLIKTCLRAVLTSCVILDDQKYVNTGTAPGSEELASADQPRL